MAKEEENEFGKKSFLDAIEKGDQEFVKVFLLQKKEKEDFKLDQFRDKIFIYSKKKKLSSSSLFLSLLLSSSLFLSLVFVLTSSFMLKYGNTALHIAAWRGYEPIAKILIEHGSNVHLQDQVLIFLFFLIFMFLFLCFSNFFICCCCSLLGSLLGCLCEWLLCLCDI